MKKHLLGLVFAVSTIGAMAQSAAWNFNYLIAMPLGESKEWVDQTSFRGFALDGRSFVEENLSIGGSMSWQGFYEKREDQLIELDNTDIFGDQFRYINTFNVSFDAHYYFGQPYSIRPYIGGGIGPYYVSQRGDLGLWSLLWEGWHFGVRPEVGVFIPFNNSDYGLNLGAKYNYIFKRKDTITNQYLAFNIGLLHML